VQSEIVDRSILAHRLAAAAVRVQLEPSRCEESSDILRARGNNLAPAVRPPIDFAVFRADQLFHSYHAQIMPQTVLGRLPEDRTLPGETRPLVPAQTLSQTTRLGPSALEPNIERGGSEEPPPSLHGICRRYFVRSRRS